MASAKIGSLVYEVIADARKFKAGIKPLQNRITAFNKMLLATRTPLEQMQLELKGIAKVAKTGIQPTDAITRTVAQLSVATKGGSRSVKAFVKDLRTQANAIDVTGTFTGELTKKQRIQRDSLRKVADETEREVAKTRQALAVKRRAELQERRAARVSRQREELLRRVNGTIQRSITPMERLRREQVNLTAAYKKGAITLLQYEKAMGMLRREQEKQTSTSKKQKRGIAGMDGVFVGMGKNLIGITAAYKGIRIAQEAFNQSLELERAQKQFEVFTGSAQVANRLTKQLRAFGRETPLTFEGGAQAVKTLLQYGVAQDVVIDRMRRLADISGGSLESLQRLSLAFGQITANGRLQGQELRQLVEAGFNPLQSISKRTGESMEVLRKRMADGNLGIDEMTQALVDATSEGGRFNDMLNEIGSDTNFGRIQRLAGLLKDMAAQKMTPLAEAAGEAAAGMSSRLSRSQQIDQLRKNLFDLNRRINQQRGDFQMKSFILRRPLGFSGQTPKGMAGASPTAMGMQAGVETAQMQVDIIKELRSLVTQREKALADAARQDKIRSANEMRMEMGLKAIANPLGKLPMEQIKQIGIAAAQKTKDAFKPLVNTLGRKLPNAFAPTISLFKQTPPLLKQAFELQRAENEQRRQSEQDAATAAKDRLQAEMDRFREESQQRKEAIEKSSVAAKSFQGGSVEEFNFLRDKQLQADKIEAERKIAQEEAQQRESLNQELIEALKEIFGNNQQAPEIGVI